MSNKKGSSKKDGAATRRAHHRAKRRRKYLGVVAVLLTAMVAVSVVLGRLGSIRKLTGGGELSSRYATQPTAPPSIPSPEHPSKEYIYGGGKLIAIESGKSDQTISFSSIPDKTYGNAPFSVNASASSGLGVSFTVTSGPASVSGNTVTLTGAGAVSIRADQAGNDSFNPGQPVTQSFNVAKANAGVTLISLSQTYDGAAHYGSATTSPANLNVTFSYTQSGTTVNSPTNAGSYAVTATVNDSNYQGNATDTLIINKATATLSFNSSSLSQTYDGSAKSATATSTPAGLTTVTLTYDGSTTAPTNAGSYSVVASLANSNYQATNATGTLTVAKAAQTITFNALGDKTYGDSPFAVSATSSSSLSITFSIVSGPATVSGSTVTLTGAGSVTVRAAQSGDANFNAATNSDRTFNVAKAAATITLSNLNQTYNGSPKAVSATTNPANLSGVSLTYNGSSSAPTNAGSYAVVGTLTNNNYTAGNATGTLTIAKATSLITWSSPGELAFGTALSSTQLNATASVAGTFTYSPPAGTILNVGTNQQLSLSFTPTDTTNYNNATATVSVDVVVVLLSDDFNDNSIDGAKWSVVDPSSPATVSEQSQQLLITIPPNTAAYNLLASNGTYDMRGGSVKVEVAQPISQAGWCENYLTAHLDSQNTAIIVAGAGTISFILKVNGANDTTSATYNPTTDRYWRIRHDSNANAVNFETSPNGSSWSTRKSVAAGFSFAALKFYLIAGAWGTGNSSPGAAHFDNFQASNNNPGNAVIIFNSGFEAPVQSAAGFQYGPTGGSWSFTSSGVSANSSPFTAGSLPAPQGNQVAFLQGGSYAVISQTLSVFQANTQYVVTFAAAQRMNGNAGGQDFQVYLDTNLLGTFRPTMAYTDYSTSPFTTTSGSHVLKFVGLNSSGGDNTAFLDNVRISTDVPSTPAFSDDFNDNSLDAAKWTRVNPNSTWVSEQSQQLQIAIPPNTAGYDGVYSTPTYDLTGRMVQVKIAQPISQAGYCESFFEAELDAQNYLMIDVGSGSMVLRSMVGGANDQTVISYDAAATRYWRLRHDQSANSIKFETSPDGLSWTTRKTVAVPFALTALRFYLYAGAWGTGNGSPGAAKYDNFQLTSNTWMGSAITLPGTIEVESYYDEIAEVAYHDTTSGTHGQDYDQPNYPAPTFRQPTDVDIYKSVGYSNSYLVVMQTGDWMKYPVNVKQSGNYTLYARVAWGDGPGGTFHIEVDGVDKTGAMQIPNSGWGFTNITKTGIALTPGFHVMRVIADTNGTYGYTGDLDYLYFRLEGQ